MKKIFTLFSLAVLLFSATSAVAAPNPKVRGTIKDQNGETIGFCNVMFAPVADTLNIVRGDISNADGFFDMLVPAGEYQLTVAMMGYEPYRKVVKLGEDTDLGTIVLSESAVNMAAAVVTADMVRRKADGYMFLPSGSTITTGRNSLELLSYAPGVWVDKDRGITINGKSGTKVMVNDRVLQLSSEELNAYLESLDADQIRSIEVIPDPGAQYDADATGGILKITLKRTMEGGLSGSVATSYRFHDDSYPFHTSPSMNLEYRKNRFSFYTNFSYQKFKRLEEDLEHTVYESEDQREILNDMRFKNKGDRYSWRVGSVYEVTDRQSVGIDFDWSKYEGDQNGASLGEITSLVYDADTESYNLSNNKRDRYNVSFNYKLKTDEKGSNLMLRADYMYNDSKDFQNNHSIETPVTRSLTELNRNTDRISKTDYYTFRMDYKQYLSQKVQLEAGMKYAYTDMDTDIQNEDKLAGNWISVDELNDHYLYREGVFAGYVSGSLNLGKVNFSGGLRVENTDLRPHSYVRPEDNKKQNYTDFFPTFRTIYFLNQEKGHLINAGYTRRINRPGFSQLNPFRMPLNNYTYIVGNPEMKPSYTDNYSVTGVVANKYSLTVLYTREKGAVRQIVSPDPQDPDILLYQHQNMDRISNYIVSLSLPVQVKPWWRVSGDATYMYMKNKIGDNSLNKNIFQGQINSMLSFPKHWGLDMSYLYLSGFVQGNMELTKGMNRFNVSVRKGFFDNKLTTTIFVDNVFDSGNYMYTAKINEPGKFTKQLELRNSNEPTRRYGFALRWSFRTGKDTKKVQKVVAGNEEERSR